MEKTARVIILMSPEDKEALFELAKERGESVGATIRTLVEKERARHNKRPPRRATGRRA